jgi:hypothetical protein
MLRGIPSASLVKTCLPQSLTLLYCILHVSTQDIPNIIAAATDCDPCYLECVKSTFELKLQGSRKLAGGLQLYLASSEKLIIAIRRECGLDSIPLRRSSGSCERQLTSEKSPSSMY